MSRLSVNSACPCGSGVKYKKCCKRFHDGLPVPDPVQLVKARYAAYAMGQTRFIMDTTHPDYAAAQGDETAWRASIQRFSRECDFLGLEILDHATEESQAFVGFRALLRQGERDASFSERSRFLPVDGQWLYHSGEIT